MVNHDNRSSANTTHSGRVITSRETQREATWLPEPSVSPYIEGQVFSPWGHFSGQILSNWVTKFYYLWYLRPQINIIYVPVKVMTGWCKVHFAAGKLRQEALPALPVKQGTELPAAYDWSRFFICKPTFHLSKGDLQSQEWGFFQSWCLMPMVEKVPSASLHY